MPITQQAVKPSNWHEMSAEARALYVLKNVSPVELETFLSDLSKDDREAIQSSLNGIATKAAEYSGYLDARWNPITDSDNGHTAGMRGFNANGKRVWVGIFGYNAYLGCFV